MSDPSASELFTAAAAVIAFVVVAWSVSWWLARRGHTVRPVTMLDHHLTQVEEQTARMRADQNIRIEETDRRM